MRFLAQTDCFFGSQRYVDFGQAASQLHGRGLALVDAAVFASEPTEIVLKNIQAAVGSVLQVKEVNIKSEPTYDQLDGLSIEVRDLRPDYLVGIGGGSLLDLAKGASLLLTNPGSGRDYRGVGLVMNRPRPLIAVPTTAGTGSEATWTASFIDDITRVKFGINGNNVFPFAAVLEPSLLQGSPRKVALSSALDALVHAVEAVSSPMASPPTDALATKAVSLVSNCLPLALETDDLEAWEAVQLGAYLAGLAMQNSSGGIASGVSYPVGAVYGVPHGFAGGVILPYIVQFNSDHGFKGYELFEPANQRSIGFAERLWELYEQLDVPKDFGSWGIRGRIQADEIFSLTVTQRSANLALNPVSFTEADLVDLLGKLCCAP